jgi:hypothetical protein
MLTDSPGLRHHKSGLVQVFCPGSGPQGQQNGQQNGGSEALRGTIAHPSDAGRSTCRHAVGAASVAGRVGSSAPPRRLLDVGRSQVSALRRFACARAICSLRRFVSVGPERYQNAHSSGRDRIVLVDQAAEEITPFDLWHDRHRLNVALLLRYSQLDAAVRSLGVVVTGVARENTIEMTATEDQGPFDLLSLFTKRSAKALAWARPSR